MKTNTTLGIIRRVASSSTSILTPRFAPSIPRTVNRRAFLRGASSIAIGLPFLESLQSHSAWAQGSQPVFSLFVGVANGVVGKDFYPSGSGALTASNLGKNTSALAEYVNQISIIRKVNYPGNLTNCGHAQGACQMLTGSPASGGGNTATSTNESADTFIAKQLNGGLDPIASYAGQKGGYINERTSFVAAGQVRAAESSTLNQFKRIFQQASDEGFSGVSSGSGGGTATPAPTTPGVAPVIDDLTLRRKSVVDLVHDELMTLEGRMGLNATDKQRLDTHLSALRQIEIQVASDPATPSTDPVTSPPSVTSSSCSASALNEGDYGGGSPKSGEEQEQIAKLHMEIIAFAFACNVNRTATLQVGDGTDSSIYNVPSNSRGWKFHHISHRTQSDSVSGNDGQAETAHSEIDALRMDTLLHGIKKFDSFGLLDKSFIMWTSHIADGPSHSFSDLPFIIAGNAGGYLKTGQSISANTTNNKLLNTLISAAGIAKQDFGGGQGGLIDALKA